LKSLLPFVPNSILSFPDISPKMRALLRKDNTQIDQFLYYRMINQLQASDLASLFRRESASESLIKTPIVFFNESMRKYENGSSLSQALDFDLEHYLPDDLLHKMDMASMSYSLEVRSPFLNQRLIEFSRRFDPSSHIKNGGKHLLKLYAERFFSKEFVHRSKMGFGIPKRHWLQTSMKATSDEILFSRDSKIYEHFDFQSINNVYSSFTSSNIHENLIWNLVILERWLRKWL
jgi:hypothetical protein